MTPELPAPKAGKFWPGQVWGDYQPVPGYSCRTCWCLVIRGRFFQFHAWNRSIFGDWRKLDFHRARILEEGEHVGDVRDAI